MKYGLWVLVVSLLAMIFASCERDEEPLRVVSLIGVYEGDYTTISRDSMNVSTTTVEQGVRVKMFTVTPNLYTVGVFRDSFLQDTIRTYKMDLYDNSESLEDCDYKARTLPQVYRPFYVELNRTDCSDLYMQELERDGNNYEERIFEGVRITKFE
jgi:hypothetical protein